MSARPSDASPRQCLQWPTYPSPRGCERCHSQHCECVVTSAAGPSAKAMPLPLIQVLLPHLRVSRGVLGLARSGCERAPRERLTRLCGGSRPVILRSHIPWNERLCFRTYGSGPATEARLPHNHEATADWPGNAPERVDSVNTPRNAANAPLSLFPLNSYKLSRSCPNSV